MHYSVHVRDNTKRREFRKKIIIHNSGMIAAVTISLFAYLMFYAAPTETI